MRLLGAIIAGGGSRRFGGDKAAAVLDGRALIDHVVSALAPQVEDLVICGRDWSGMVTVTDRPTTDLGPLGGLCGALHYAAANRFDAVLTAGCDVLPLPDLSGLTGPTAAVIEGQHLFGFWPVALTAVLDRHLADQPDRSIRQWVIISGARTVACTRNFYNLNTRNDLKLYSELDQRELR
jgi:molybdopterin-guanine dinucleotide biosynthesis protein A